MVKQDMYRVIMYPHNGVPKKDECLRERMTKEAGEKDEKKKKNFKI